MPTHSSQASAHLGRTVIITGGTRGIGYATAEAFLAAGAHVVITSRSQESADAAAAALNAGAPSPSEHDGTTPGALSPNTSATHAEQHGSEQKPIIAPVNATSRGTAIGVGAHAARPESAEKTCTIARETFGRIDCLINNAGTNPCYGPVTDQDPELLAKLFALNTIAPVSWTSAALRAGLGEHHNASVINVASIGALAVEDNIGAYNASKAALLHLTKQMARELAPVRINAISPGVVRTKLSEALWKEHEAAVNAITPLGRIGEPHDCAHAILFLSSPHAAWITGENLVIDGGQRIGTSVTH